MPTPTRTKSTGISIHAPREGGDYIPSAVFHDVAISIHAPREGGDARRGCMARGISSFQSTPPARGATAAYTDGNGGSVFQSTPPARGATFNGGSIIIARNISIHAPREGGDPVLGAGDHGHPNFNPRPPRGGRRKARCTCFWTFPFQSTPPARGATSRPAHRSRQRTHFNPRPPRGGRHSRRREFAASVSFQSTPPARGATRRLRSSAADPEISIHAPREGGDLLPW